MSWTKRQLILQAFDEIGFAYYVYDLSAERIESATRRLDTMAATWNRIGIRLGYPLPSTPNASDLDTDTGITDEAMEALYLNLAIRIAPSLGKVVSRDTKVAAKKAYNALLNKIVQPPEKQLPSYTPAGSGNNSVFDGPFLNPPSDLLESGGDSTIDDIEV